jgi:DNA-binding CsgD family transcriptional regulator
MNLANAKGPAFLRATADCEVSDSVANHEFSTEGAQEAYYARQLKFLSERELQCLSWMVYGKTAWETGVILGISNRTVEKHLSSSLKKLQLEGSRNHAAFLLGKYDLI